MSKPEYDSFFAQVRANMLAQRQDSGWVTAGRLVTLGLASRRGILEALIYLLNEDTSLPGYIPSSNYGDTGLTPVEAGIYDSIRNLRSNVKTIVGGLWSEAALATMKHMQSGDIRDD